MRIPTFAAAGLITLLLSALALHASQSASPGATISGYVVDAGTQVPIAGARVMILPASIGRQGPAGRPPSQAVTGDDGSYILSGVAAGRYRLQVQKLGYVAPNAGQAPIIDVAAGQSLTGPVFRLTRGAAISGRLLDARREPLAEMTVQALRRPAPNGAPGRGRGGRGMPALPAGQAGQTNDVGEFRIAGLEAGDYYVAASARPAMPFGQSSPSSGTTPITTYYPGSADLAGAQVITVAAGQNVGGLDFIMLTGSGYSISGVVVDEANQPIEGAMVMAMPAAMTVAGLGPRGSSRTGADGTFTMGSVVPGTYRLSASVPMTMPRGGGTAGGGFVTWSSSSGGSVGGSVQVTVGDADVGGVTIVAKKQ